jgi:hypothetical protein
MFIVYEEMMREIYRLVIKTILNGEPKKTSKRLLKE